MHLSGCKTDCINHTITVNSRHINVCCWHTNRLTILNLDGEVKSIHGPDIEVQNNSRGARNRDRSMKSRIYGSSVCQEDDEGNVPIANYGHHRLLLFTSECKWHDVTPSGGLHFPRGAVWLNGRLYVISLFNKFITMFE